MWEREIAWFSSLMGLVHNKNWAENVNAVDFRSGKGTFFCIFTLFYVIEIHRKMEEFFFSFACAC